MKAPPLKKQKTITINGQKITIVAKRKTSMANFVGWNVDINGERKFVNCLTAKEAMDIAFVRWLKKHGK